MFKSSMFYSRKGSQRLKVNIMFIIKRLTTCALLSRAGAFLGPVGLSMLMAGPDAPPHPSPLTVFHPLPVNFSQLSPPWSILPQEVFAMKLFLAILLFTASCSPLVWTKPNTTDADYRRDYSACADTVGSIPPSQLAMVSSAVAVAYRDSIVEDMQRCMKKKGWKQERVSR